MPTVRIIGPGRAGGALALALAGAGWDVDEPVRRGDDLTHVAIGPDLLVIATPDGAIAEVAAAIQPTPGALVAHMAGSLGLDVLGSHAHRACIHPLVPIPDAHTGARRMRGAWFGVAASTDSARRQVDRTIADLGARAVTIDDEDRAAYHAAAAIASNHLVALLGQVERVAATAGVPLEAYLDLVRATVDNVALLGPVAALTGPIARGDEATVERHRAALPADELAAYDALADQARRLVAGRGTGAR
ncbi:DUF2520 domain-containing protein [Actinomarinicola tropica]|uniref:DUF2520 domain-containing protein n=1 Tax=Actinomarinicola tropica TaxID=2789776 RepID=A0A5Q2RTF2_9ACTN|nr:DUF2520 domain-containing protein [Actinomarinicola tropica]QGG96495.1 DUF2520 domain-containing protein [Actinomarinicola tropica]